MKTSELTGQQLDQAVVECEGHVEKSTCWLAMPVLYAVWNGNYKPSTNWSQGGPIIEREKISVQPNGDHWIAFDCGWLIDGTGPTPLIAAMRCYVASKLGDEVDKPDQLTERETKNG
jgi:hypothetical protein